MEPDRPTFPPRRALGRAALVAALAVSACGVAARPPAPAPPPTPAESSRSEWPRELALAQAAVERREYALADSVLRAFSARFPGTNESADATYWRALFRLDPAAPRDSTRDPVREAVVSLDAYLAGGPLLPRYVEASALRRLATLLDSLRVAAGTPRGLPNVTALRDTMKAQQDEVARLQKELQETTAELERIRRRLAPRRP